MNSRLKFVLRVSLGLLIIVMQLPPFERWAWHKHVMAGAIALAAIDFIGQAVRGKDPILGALAAYTVTVAAGFVLKEILDAPRVALIPVAALTGISAATCIGFLGRRGRRTRELDRLIFSEATSIAFFTTLFFAVSWASAETWLDLPSLNAWGFAAVGMFSWVAASIVLRKRYA
jgi:hypothetical protein